MTATNHALTGTAIGLVSGQPALALPAAVVSHYVCDIIPHFGTRDPKKALKSRAFKNYLIVEAIICFLIVLGLFTIQPTHWLLAAICAFLAAAPDLLSINRYLKIRRGQAWHGNWYSNWAHKIQWFERPIGAIVEIAWLGAMLAIIVPIINS